MVNNLYAVWIKIDEALPWIEMKGVYQTKREARRAAREFLRKTGIKVVAIPDGKSQIKALATIKHS